MAVRPEAYGDAGPSWVVTRAEAELVERYGRFDESESGLTGAMFEPPRGVFLVARTADSPRPVGGAGLRSVGTVGTGEVKRLWVDPTWRGRGVGRRLVGDLEEVACNLGFAVLELGTADRQPEASPLRVGGVGAPPRRRDGHPLPVCHIRFSKRLG